jgi:hypothetical protein
MLEENNAKCFYVIDGIEIDPREVEVRGESESLRLFLEKAYSLVSIRVIIIKRSVDARKKHNVVWRYKIAIEIDSSIADALSLERYVVSEEISPSRMHSGKKVIIIGAGPAGYFCALRLVEYGISVTIVERGKAIEERNVDVSNLKKSGILNPESNILFGEGGAGTYSDGKLTARTHKPGTDWFFKRIIECGADEEILYDAKPHIGTDILCSVVRTVRKKIISGGGRIYFGKIMSRLIISENSVRGVQCCDGTEIMADAVVLAAGHSSRDTYQMLKDSGVYMESKGFAVGMRIEHPAVFINKAQYGSFSDCMPAADYRLAYNDASSGRGVYSFCMCPGGEIVNSSSEEGLLCVNGMSYSNRGMPHSNAAIVVSIFNSDFKGDPIAGIRFQQEIEKSCYRMGSAGYYAPAQKGLNFIRGESTTSEIQSSYLPGIIPGRLDTLYPEWITEPLKKGLMRFNNIIPGFAEHGILVGAETRTSSPVRVTRDDSMQSVSHKGLYPIGEGAGYAGGIVSSAVDGIRCADTLVGSFKS